MEYFILTRKESCRQREYTVNNPLKDPLKNNFVPLLFFRVLFDTFNTTYSVLILYHRGNCASKTLLKKKFKGTEIRLLISGEKRSQRALHSNSTHVVQDSVSTRTRL